jgi:hypothetical protein
VKDETLWVPSNVTIPDVYRTMFIDAGLTTAATPGLHQWFVRVEPHVNALACAAMSKMAWRNDLEWVVAEVKRAYLDPDARKVLDAAFALGGREAAYEVAKSIVPEYPPERMYVSFGKDFAPWEST